VIFYGEVDGKTETPTQSWQQKETCPLESQTQEERLIGRVLCELRSTHDENTAHYAVP
jgi:hypothetical protein